MAQNIRGAWWLMMAFLNMVKQNMAMGQSHQIPSEKTNLLAQFLRIRYQKAATATSSNSSSRSTTRTTGGRQVETIGKQLGDKQGSGGAKVVWPIPQWCWIAPVHYKWVEYKWRPTCCCNSLEAQNDLTAMLKMLSFLQGLADNPSVQLLPSVHASTWPPWPITSTSHH